MKKNKYWNKNKKAPKKTRKSSKRATVTSKGFKTIQTNIPVLVVIILLLCLTVNIIEGKDFNWPIMSWLNDLIKTMRNPEFVVVWAIWKLIIDTAKGIKDFLKKEK